MLFFQNAPRKKRKTARGNYVYRRKGKGKRTTKEDQVRLDLKLETDASRRERLRRSAGYGARVAAAMLLTFVFIALLKVVVVEAFWKSDRFQLHEINVVTRGPVTKSVIKQTSGLHEGDHMLMISLRSVRDRLEAMPEVRSAKVTRSFPGSILIEVEQRQPVAWLECPDKSVVAKVSDYGCLLDDSGIVVPCDHTPTAAEKKLPVVRVDKLTRIALGKNIESPSALAALKLLRIHQDDATLQAMPLTKVDASRAHALTAEYSTGLSVTFPATNDLEKEAHRLNLTLAEAAKHRWRLATVNLLVEHNVPITLSKNAETVSVNAARTTLAEAH